jgi:nitroimidazol reductase NimA-like FMN-containing flavoprotein (pyridoxamine 5'-phosphate oxidase superfamily)
MDPLTRPEIDQILAESPVAHLGVVDENGGPYVTPLSYVYTGDTIAFRTLEGRRIAALRANPRVCIEVMEYEPEGGDWLSVIAFGTAEIVEDDIAAGAFIAQLLHKYEQTFEGLFGLPAREGLTVAYVVRVLLDDVSGRTSGRFLSTRTRPGRL